MKAMQEYKLNSGITIVDYTDQKLGFKVNNIDTEYMQLLYSKEDGFYISMAGFEMTMSKIDKFNDEYKLLSYSLIEANVILRELENGIKYSQEEIRFIENATDPFGLIEPENMNIDRLYKIRRYIMEFNGVDYANLSESDINKLSDIIKNETCFIVSQNIIAFLLDYKVKLDSENPTELDNKIHNNSKKIIQNNQNVLDYVLGIEYQLSKHQ